MDAEKQFSAQERTKILELSTKAVVLIQRQFSNSGIKRNLWNIQAFKKCLSPPAPLLREHPIKYNVFHHQFVNYYNAVWTFYFYTATKYSHSF